MKRTDTNILVGLMLSGAGFLFLLVNLGLLDSAAAAIWAAAFAVGGGAFLAVFWRDRATSELGAQADALRLRDIAVKTAVVNGHAAEVLVDEAARRGVDLIVMATHGYSGLKRWALGSVADKVLHATTTPLLLVRAQPES